MTMPTNVGAIDLMMGTKAGTAARRQYEYLRKGAKDAETKSMHMPAEYMFKDVPHRPDDSDENDVPQGPDLLLPAMDRNGVDRAMIGVHGEGSAAAECLELHPDRFFASFEIDPNQGMDGVRALVDAHERWDVKAATCFPAGYVPQVPINDKKMYPFYAKCVELDIPICICAGVPGPRLPMACQDVVLLDEVCYDFPELRLVTRHGCEPWTDLAVKLMLKWPGLYYSTSAFAPKYYPEAIVDYANTRGADKVMYAGYFPMALDLDRIFTEMRAVPFKDEVWPKFLRENAQRVFKLD
jgi:predicted TIM-barrel fold metal-dependent hydrolase